MSSSYQYTPAGTRDLLFEECRMRRNVEKRLSDFFERAGFSEVITPLIEYYDVFNTAVSTSSQEEMYKLIDASGKILVLRPDSTLPIARMVCTRLRDAAFPIKLHYTQNVYRNNRGARGKRNELSQSGVEIIGQGGMRADLESITTAIRAFCECGLSDLKIELGHVGFFKALVSQVPFTGEDLEKIRYCVEYKNFAALNDVLDRYGDYSASKSIRMLPQLFGDREILDTALEIAGSREAAEIIRYLIRVYDVLMELGYQDIVSIDLGLVHHIGYYTGLVFRGYAEGSGENVLSGGRYDGLLAAYGLDLPATGFAVNVDETAQLLAGRAAEGKRCETTLVFCDEVHLAKALSYVDGLRKRGVQAQFSLFSTLQETTAYAAKQGISKITVVGDQISTVAQV